jgi:riboflavin kinase / FMN adenylyltransferase
MSRPVVDALDQIAPGPYVVTIGNFDGVHRGHQHVLERVVESARIRTCASLVITFDPLPIEVLRPDVAPLRLTTTEDRVQLIQSRGIDQVVVLRFDTEFASQSADAFLDQLVTHASPAEIIVGHDFAFGHKRAGTAEYLQQVGPSLGMDVTVITRIDADGEELSSSVVRRALIEDGDVRSAASTLGRPYRLSGIVEDGSRRGRTLGYPTANLATPERMVLPADGIYAALASLPDADKPGPALVYIGRRPTFEGDRRVVEVYLIDMSRDLYGQRVSVDFMERIRGDRRFETPDHLIRQMNDDERAARVYFTEAGFDLAPRRG